MIDPTERNQLPEAQGLYDPRNEHDSCGIGYYGGLDIHGLDAVSNHFGRDWWGETARDWSPLAASPLSIGVRSEVLGGWGLMAMAA